MIIEKTFTLVHLACLHVRALTESCTGPVTVVQFTGPGSQRKQPSLKAMSSADLDTVEKSRKWLPQLKERIKPIAEDEL